MSTSGPISSVDQPFRSGSQGSVDRDWLLTAGGATLLFLALSRRSTIGLAGLLGAGYFLYRSLPTGTLPGLLPESLGAIGLSPSAGQSERAGQDWFPAEGTDGVDESSMDSFPASDPATKY